ncbi:dual specificity protein phosphatase 3-like [Diadema antillarum]|uniref:dual specificity protein phosphatase 3-like n=1 Tax=Diadema antillarum TaxID=105358 RepID=UPI003A880218
MAADSDPCTVEELDGLLWLSEDESLGGLRNDCDEVFTNVYVGDESIARNKDKLGKLGITHVLNCGQGNAAFHVNTDESYYEDVKIKFCGLKVADIEGANLKEHFGTAVRFIDEALDEENGKILVHCVAGYSRSATVAMAYLMMRRGMRARDAVRAVRKKRDVGPNVGFLLQLCQLDEELRQK